MKKKMYIACKEEKILREAKGKSTIWGQWPVIARVQVRVPRESTPRDAKEINFQKIPEENTLSASNEKDFVLIDVTPLCRRIHLIICFYQAHYIHFSK